MTTKTGYVETSVIVAILLEEADEADLRREIVAAPRRVTAVTNAVEAATAIGRRIGDLQLGTRMVEEFLQATETELLAVQPDLFPDVVKAYDRYGKGGGHAAKLNFGDCFSYALAKRLGASLIYKGDDFSHTDLAG